MPKMLEMLEKMARGEIPSPPIGQLIGFRLADVKSGEAVVDFTTNGEHANPMGTLHGGVILRPSRRSHGNRVRYCLKPYTSNPVF